MITPPRLALRLLAARLHPDEREELVGDLVEQYHQRAARQGALAATLWCWRQCLALAWGFGVHRRDVISTNHERVRGRWLVANAASDWRYAWRAAKAAPGATSVAWLTLTLALGLSTTVFSIANGLLLRPLPYPSADRLVRIAEAMVDRSPYATSQVPVLSESGGRVSDTGVGQFVETAAALELVTPYTTGARVVRAGDTADVRPYAEVGAGFFDLLGARPRLGRLFVEADGAAGAAPTVVVSERFWREALGARADVAGTTLLIDDKPHTIAGVVAGDLRFPDPDIDIWIALSRRWPQPGARRNFMTSLDLVARLAPGATIDDANREAGQIGSRIAASDPAYLDGVDVPVPEFRVRSLQQDLVHPIRPALLVLMAGMALVLLVAAANLVNLLLARNTARHREMAVRLTLGAGRWRIVRPLLFEQLLVAAAGAASGALLAWVLLRVMPALAPEALGRLADVRFDYWSLAFAATTALVLGLVVGLLPAWQLPHVSLRDASSAGRTVAGTRVLSAETVRRGLVVLQVSLAVVLVVGAALLGRTMWALGSVHPGYVGQGALIFQLGVPDLLFRQPERQRAFFDELLARIGRSPTVTAAGLTSTLPLHQVGLSGSLAFEGRPRPTTPAEWPRSNKIAISPGYLEAVGTRIIRGRGFTDADSDTSEPVALVDESLVAKYFPNEDPIGRRIDFLRKMWRIVGVTEAIKQRDVTVAADPVTYFPDRQVPPVLGFNRLTGGIAVRSSGDPMDLLPGIRAALQAVDPTVPLHGAERLEDRLSGTFAEPRFYTFVVGLFAGLALAVALLGVYGVLSYSVERRQVEFGVRRALGGDERHILGLVLRQASVLVLAGAAMGLVVAFAGTGVLRTLLFGVAPFDVPTYAATAVGLWMVGLVASFVPAWRATRIDPARALKAD